MGVIVLKTYQYYKYNVTNGICLKKIVEALF